MRAEQTAHAESAFLTLTIEDSELTWRQNAEDGVWHPTLVKRDLQDYFRKLRKQGHKLRYFACGEYGEKTGRPHYHAIVFGLGIGAADMFEDSWKQGYTTTLEANPRTMSYVAKYCLKGSRDPDPISKLFEPNAQERRVIEPPFRITSRRPAIGHPLSKAIAETFMTRMGSHVLVSGRAEKRIKIGRDSYPLDETMRRNIRKHMDIPEAMKDAIFSSQPWEPTDEETQAARQAHQTTVNRGRHKRSKL